MTRGHSRTEITDTLRQRVVSALHFGTLRPGDRLPSARILAAELRADARVVMSVYRQLERDGLAERRPPSRAYFVAPAHAAAGSLVAAVDWLVDVVAESVARGVPAPDFPEHARQCLETLRLRAACIECNRDQLVWLGRELHEDYGVLATEVDVELLRARDGLPQAVRSADLLVTTTSHVGEVQPIARALGKPWLSVTVRRDLVTEVGELLASGPVYFVGTDVRFATKLEQLFAASDDADKVRPVILGRDDVHAIPAGSPAWVMRTARDALGGIPPHLRALPTLRAFSAETRRAVLDFVVRANVAVLAAR